MYGGGKSGDVPIANFIARAILQTTRDDGTKSESWYVLEGIAEGGKPLETIKISAGDFDSMNWVSRWGIGTIIFPGRRYHLQTAIQLASRDAEREIVYCHLGWRLIKDKWVYLHAAGAVGSQHATVEMDRMLGRYQLPASVRDLKKAARASLDVLRLAPLRVTLPLLSTVYLAPLCEPLRRAGLEPNFSTWLYGRTGTRKTSIALVLLSHLGKFGRTGPPASFKDTANALEMKAALAKDVVLAVDDYHPSASGAEAAVMATTAQKLLRMYGDRIGRGRMNSGANGFRTEYVPAGMALITGEDLPTGHSSVARLFAVELTPEDVNLNELTRAQGQGDLLAESMLGYIEHLRARMDTLPEHLGGRFAEFRGAFREAAHGRLSEAAAWLLLAFEQFLRYLQEVEAVSPEQADELYSEAWSVLLESVALQSADIVAEVPGQVFLSALREMLDSQAIYPDQPNRSVAKVFRYHSDLIGWQERDQLCFLPRALYGAVNVWLRDKGRGLGVTERVLMKQLEELGAIITERPADSERVNRSIKRKLPWEANKRTRVLVFPASALVPDA